MENKAHMKSGGKIEILPREELTNLLDSLYPGCTGSQCYLRDRVKMDKITMELDRDLTTPNSKRKSSVFIGGIDAFLAYSRERSRQRQDGGKMSSCQDVQYFSNGGHQILKKMLVRGQDSKNLIVSKVIFEDKITQSSKEILVDHIFISPSPFVQALSIDSPRYSLLEHLRDVVSGYWRLSFYKTMNCLGYRPSFRSLLRHTMNEIETFAFEENMLPDIEQSDKLSVLVIRIDCSKANIKTVNDIRNAVSNAQFLRQLENERRMCKGAKEYICFAAEVESASGSFTGHKDIIDMVRRHLVSQLLDEDGVSFGILQKGKKTDNGYKGSNFCVTNLHIHVISGEAKMGIALKHPVLKMRPRITVRCYPEQEGLNQGVLNGDVSDQLSQTVRRRLGIDDSLSTTETTSLLAATAIGVGIVLLPRLGSPFKMSRMYQGGYPVTLRPSTKRALISLVRYTKKPR